MGMISSLSPATPISRTQKCCAIFNIRSSFKTQFSIFQFRLPSSIVTFPSLSLQVSASSTIASPGAGVVVKENDLLIVGPGVLGRLVAERWMEEHPGCQVHGRTMTTDHHHELTKMGISPSLKDTEAHRFPFVIFCAPPSQTSDYPADVRNAAMSWNGQGSFLFTSSSAPYDCSDNGPCDEETPVVSIGRSPKTDVLLRAEHAVLDAGGCVVRLAGLYKANRGAHNYWLEKGIVEARPDHIVNLIHYEDAATLSVAILKKKFCGRIFIGCDNHPLSRQKIMDLVNNSGKFKKKFEAFTGQPLTVIKLLPSLYQNGWSFGEEVKQFKDSSVSWVGAKIY